MQLESYFEFLAEDDIRIKGTRIGIEHVLDEFLNGESPEAIAEQFPTVALEQVYATILYYLSDREQVGKYFEDWVEYTQQTEAEYEKNLPPVVIRLRQLRAANSSTTDDQHSTTNV